VVFVHVKYTVTIYSAANPELALTLPKQLQLTVYSSLSARA